MLQDLGSAWDHWNGEERKELAALGVAEGANRLGLERQHVTAFQSFVEGSRGQDGRGVFYHIEGVLEEPEVWSRSHWLEWKEGALCRACVKSELDELSHCAVSQ